MWTEGIVRGRTNGESQKKKLTEQIRNGLFPKNVRRVTFMVRCYSTRICKEAWFFNVPTSCVDIHGSVHQNIILYKWPTRCNCVR